MSQFPKLQKLRQCYQPQLPKILQNLERLIAHSQEKKGNLLNSTTKLLPKISGQPTLHFFEEKNASQHRPLRIGTVLSGGPAAGGHNVIIGLFDSLKKLNPQSQLFGFLNGPGGIIGNKYIELKNEILQPYRNQGGFDLIGSGRAKIETPEQFKETEKTVNDLKLDGLVIIGGDDSNTNAALLAEHFLNQDISTKVIGVPKTIDGDLKNEYIEVSFGFDTATKTYSEIVGNVLRDCLSQKKYYFFIKLMGRSASHIALECALQTHPNLTLIGEEIASKQQTLQEITNQICNVICARASKGKNYGAILIPEGIIEFIPESKKLIKELNALPPNTDRHTAVNQLGEEAKRCFNAIPKGIQEQLLLDRDPHGNIRVSQIETERLFIETVQNELNSRASKGQYSGKLDAQPLFCGYEGRSCFPSNFDSQYCYALGYGAALLINGGATGYMCCMQNLACPVEEWRFAGIPLADMIHFEDRGGKSKPVIKKALVELERKPFKTFMGQRESWILNDDYRYPGPIQFFGPRELTDCITMTLQLESRSI